MDCSLLQGYFVIARLCLMYFHWLFAVQTEDVESSPVRAPPTETPTFYTQTDDEDWAESSGDDMLLNSPKGERSRPIQAFTLSNVNFPFLSYSFFLILNSLLSNNLFTRWYFTSQAIKEPANHLICLCRFFICYCCIYYLCYLKYDRNRSIMISVCVFQSLSDQREPLKTEMWVTESDLFSCLSRFLLS